MCLSLYGYFCIVAWNLLFSSKSVCLFIGVVMTSFLESNSFFKLGISSCKDLVFWFWQHSIFATVLLIFSSMIQILLALLWAIFLSDVLVAFQIVQKFFLLCWGFMNLSDNEGVSDWIGNWGDIIEDIINTGCDGWAVLDRWLQLHLWNRDYISGDSRSHIILNSIVWNLHRPI